MNDELLGQARTLLSTIRDLQATVILKNAPANAGLDCAAKELTLPQMSTLAVIREHEGLSLKEIAEATRVSAPSASAMVDRLVDIGVVTRVPSTTDRREVRIALSSEGETAVNAMEGQLLQAITSLLEKLGAEDARQWCEVYAKIQSILDAEKHERRSSASRRSSVV